MSLPHCIYTLNLRAFIQIMVICLIGRYFLFEFWFNEKIWCSNITVRSLSYFYFRNTCKNNIHTLSITYAHRYLQIIDKEGRAKNYYKIKSYLLLGTFLTLKLFPIVHCKPEHPVYIT
uniref:Uncharacterized protein n=1 Tax=Cacopsylla melanoneura TaxID=428564 RepID=A0A8D8ZEK4_9HEMI